MQFSMATAMYKVFSILKCGSAVGKSITEEVVRKSYRVLTSAVFKTPSSSSLVNHVDNGQPVAWLHTSPPKRNLMEFFDNKDNWGEATVKVGRPWKKDELRLKSNEDIHKLWYVLLKERNMLMTMAEEYKRQGELFPSPERLEKVEESMENILAVVAERDVAYSTLETGESCEPGRRWAYNELGIGYWRKCTEHYVPLYMNNRLRRKTSLSGPWQHHFLRLMREKRLRDRARKLRRLHAIHRAYSEKFPDSELELDLSEFQNTLAQSIKGPEKTLVAKQ